MLNVFSDNLKPSDKIRLAKMCAGSELDRTLFAGSEDEPLYILKPKAIDLLRWVNRKILFELPKVKTFTDSQWVGVRIRIATNMLNKLEAEGVLTKTVCTEYHMRMTSRVREILGDILTEDLPF